MNRSISVFVVAIIIASCFSQNNSPLSEVPSISTSLTVVKTWEYDCSFVQLFPRLLNHDNHNKETLPNISTFMTISVTESSGITHRRTVYLEPIRKHNPYINSLAVENRAYNTKSPEDLEHLYSVCCTYANLGNYLRYHRNQSGSVAVTNFDNLVSSENKVTVTQSVKSEYHKYQLALDYDQQESKDRANTMINNEFSGIIGRSGLYLTQLFYQVYPNDCHITQVGVYHATNLELYQYYWTISRQLPFAQDFSDIYCDPNTPQPIYLFVEPPSTNLLSNDPHLRYNPHTISDMCDLVSNVDYVGLYTEYSRNLSGMDWCYLLKSGILPDNVVFQPLRYYGINK